MSRDRGGDHVAPGQARQNLERRHREPLVDGADDRGALPQHERREAVARPAGPRARRDREQVRDRRAVVERAQGRDERLGVRERVDNGRGTGRVDREEQDREAVGPLAALPPRRRGPRPSQKRGRAARGRFARDEPRKGGLGVRAAAPQGRVAARRAPDVVAPRPVDP